MIRRAFSFGPKAHTTMSTTAESTMFERIKTLLELIRFSHTLFALPFALLSAIVAWSMPDTDFHWQQLVGILLCMVFARSAAMAFNRLVDRDVDAGNERTAGRHIPAGLISVGAVRTFTIVCSIGFIASTLLFLPNRWPIYLSVPVLLFLLGYSYAKRWTNWCHYWLSAALMMSPIAAWIALRGEVTTVPLLLAGVVFFWVGGFDIIYACQDSGFDKEHGLHSIPSKFGIPTSLRMAAFSHVIAVACLFCLWHFGNFGYVFLGGVVLVTLLLLWEHSLVRPDDLTRVNIAFFNANVIISMGLLVTGAVDVWFL